jgi:type VI protein secretion system component VasF
MADPLDLIEHLKQVPDYRSIEGKRHELWVLLMLVLLGTLCGYRGYRSLTVSSRTHA